MMKQNHSLVSKIILIILVGVGLNLFYIRGFSSETLATFSGTSFVPLISMVIMYMMPLEHNWRTYRINLLFGFILALIIWLIGYRNVGPFYQYSVFRYFWNLLGISGTTIMFSHLLMNKQIFKHLDWKSSVSFVTAFLAGILISKPQIFILAPIDYKFTFLTNFSDALVLAILAFLFSNRAKNKNIHLGGWQNLLVAFFSLLISMVYLIGITIDVDGTLTFLKTHLAYYSVSSIVTLIFVYLFLSDIVTLVSYNNQVNSEYKKSSNNTIEITTVKILLINILLWLPYFVLYLPGTIGFDGMNQLAEFFRIHAQDGTVYYPTNHQPWFTTLLMGGIVKIGIKLFGSFSGGIAFYSFFVMVLGILTNLKIINTVVKIKNQNWGWGTLFFLSIFPIFPYWYMTFDKTGLFIIIFAWFTTSILQIFMNKHIDIKIWLSSVLFGILLVLFRNDMIYVILLTFIIGFIFNKNSRKVILSIFSVITIIYVGWNQGALKVMNIVPSPTAEMLSIPNQQVARAYAETPKEFDQKEQEDLSKAWTANKQTTEQVVSSYNYGLADNVKGNLFGSQWVWRYTLPSNDRKRAKVLPSEIKKEKKTVKRFISVWLSNLNQSPISYVTATFANVYHYLYVPGINHGNGYRLTWNGNTTTAPNFNSRLTKNYDYVLDSSIINKIRAKMGEALLHFSVIGIFLVAGSWGLLVIFVLLETLVFWRRKTFMAVVFFLTVFGINFAGPVDGGLRYLFPLMLTTPILLAVWVNRE